MDIANTQWVLIGFIGSISVRYVHQVGIAIDQLLNTILGGWADETLSARMFRNARLDEAQQKRSVWWYAEKLVNALFIWQDWLVKRAIRWTGARHCERAYNNEVNRMHFHPGMRTKNE